jgi:nitrogen regulatory protein P-II 1
MAEVVIMVLNDVGKLEEVLTAWLRLGVPGVTTVDSTGLRQEMSKRAFRDDLPLFPTLEDLIQGNEDHSRTLFAVVPDGFAIEQLVRATEQITGELDGPNTGILFTVPVGRAWGVKRP